MLENETHTQKNSLESLLEEVAEFIDGPVPDSHLDLKAKVESAYQALYEQYDDARFLELKKSLHNLLIQKCSLQGVMLEEGFRVIAELSRSLCGFIELDSEHINIGFELVHVNENKVFVWQERAGERVCSKFSEDYFVRKLTEAQAVLYRVSTALEEGDVKFAREFMDRIAGTLPSETPPSGCNQKRLALFREVALISNLLYEQDLRPDLLTTAICEAQDLLRELVGGVDSFVSHVEQYTQRVPISDTDLQAIEELQRSRLAPKGSSNGLKGVYTASELKAWLQTDGGKLLVVRDGKRLASVVLLLTESSSFPKHVQDFMKEAAIDMARHSYLGLLLAGKKTDLKDATLSAAQAARLAAAITRSYDLDGFLAWTRADHSMLRLDAQLGARLVSEPREIFEDKVYQGVYVHYSLRSDELREWCVPLEARKALEIVKASRMREADI